MNKTGNSEMCGKLHYFAGPGKYCQDCGHLRYADCHLETVIIYEGGVGKLKDIKLDYLGENSYKLTGFVENRISIGGNYCDYSLQVDIPAGFEIDLIMVEPIGKMKIEAVALIYTRECRRLDLIPKSVLLNRPLTDPATIFIPLLEGIDTSKLYTGDLKLGFTINGYESGDTLIVNYQTSMVLKRS